MVKKTVREVVESKLISQVIKGCKCEQHILFDNEPDRQGIY